jgi:uncharacterized RDD family membrane protein YckC
MNNLEEYKRPGFWIRFLATWIDCLIVYSFLKGIFYILLYSAIYFYFPFEFCFFILGMFYSIVCIAFTGQTIGKHLLGIFVYNRNGSRLSFIKSALRESVFKILSGVVLFLGFLWIGFSKNKKGWHDYLSHSMVVPSAGKKRFTLFWRTLSLSTLLIFSANYIWNFTSVIIDAKKISVSPVNLKLPFMARDPASVSDISTLEYPVFINWIDSNASDPIDYAVHIASATPVTIFGEMHESRDNLSFFNKLVEPLYFKSGVRVIALEVFPASMNRKAEKLVNGEKYDTALAMEIARSNTWKMWGFKEYWDVFESVWTLNHSLPKGAPRMRIVGIDSDWDMPGLSLLGATQDSKGKTPFWEKFRVFSVIQDLPKIIYRDEIMARNIEREIINKNQKGVILIGFNHTPLDFAFPVVKNNNVTELKPRFGVLLNNKYKGKFFQIELYFRLDFNEGDIKCNSSIDDFMDSVMKSRGNKPAGFTIISSPFENIRDSCSYFFNTYPSIRYGDIAQGLIFLKPFDEIEKCTWYKGYISDEMFMKYKPMYDLMFKGKYKNAKELNDFLFREIAN